MGSQFPSASVESIFNEVLRPHHCQCRWLKDASLVVEVQDHHSRQTCMTVAGITLGQCRNEQQILMLAQSIRDDLQAICQADQAERALFKSSRPNALCCDELS